MATPLDTLDLPDIDERLSDDDSFKDAPEADTYERHPMKETDTSTTNATNSQKHRLTGKDESLNDLEKKISENHIPHHDVINPTGQDDLFPEEYQLETDTGLVKSTTALSLQKSRTRQANELALEQRRNSNKSVVENKNNGITKEKLDKAVEKNKKSIEKSKNGKGFFHKMKEILNLN